MKSLFLCAVLVSTPVLAEGIFIGGGNLSPDFSISCDASFCGQASVEIDIEPGVEPINEQLEVVGEAFFNPNFGGHFFDTYITTIGVANLDRDAIAAQYIDSGFYLFTHSLENNVIPKADTVTVTHVDFFYDSENNSVTLSFDWESDINPFSAFLQYGLYMNADQNLDEFLSDWKVEGQSRTTSQRRIVVNSVTGLDRIDVHAVIDGEQFNFEMDEVYSNFYTWDFPPNVPDNADMEVFFNYSVNGLGVDTPKFNQNIGDLAEIFILRINIFDDSITLTDQVEYPLLGELGEDSIKLEQAFVTYKINGGDQVSFQMNRETLQQDGLRNVTGMKHTLGVDLVEGDTIEYSFYYIFEGIPYTTPWETQEL